MQIDFTPEQAALVRKAIDSGRLQRPEDAMQEAISLWAAREQRRSEILAAVDKAEASLAQGKGTTISSHAESRHLAREISERGIAQLKAEQSAR